MKNHVYNLMIAAVLAFSAAPAQKAPTVTMPPGVIIPVPVKELEIRGLELALPGISARTNNLIKLGFYRSVQVSTNDVIIATTTTADIDVTIEPSEILAAQTNYPSVSAMPLEFVTPIMYQIGLTKIYKTLPAVAAESMK